MNPQRAIVTVGISNSSLFAPYLERFERTFREFGGADYLKIWRHEWPPESPTHHECHYAFKVHAVWEAFQRGYTSILWFDSSCHAIRPLEALWDRLERDGHILIVDGNALGNWSSDHSLAEFGASRDDMMGVNLMCGTCWGVDLRNERSRTFLERLRAYAKPEHFIGTHVSRLPGLPPPTTEGACMSNDPRVRGHRSDEVYMALLARQFGMTTHAGIEFVGGGEVTERACVRSGYDIPPPTGAIPAMPGDSLPRKARNLQVVGEHTIDAALLIDGGYVLDAGCRDFTFARGLVARGCKVVALDADPTIEDPKIPGIAFFNLGIADEPGMRCLIMHDNPEARCLAPVNVEVQAKTVDVLTVTLTGLMETLGILRWDAVKLDIEGAEYGILRDWPGPIASQISIEFHEHCSAQPKSVYDEIFKHLGQWYEIVQHTKEVRHCCQPNFWDTLLIAR